MNDKPNQLNVVIADDDRTTISALRMMLRELRCTVVGEAMDGQEAVSLCDKLQPHIAFIDINMPNVDGHQATGEIRRLSPATHVIMISAISTVANIQQSRQAGASGFVVKPFNATRLIEAINRCYEIKK